MTAWWPATSPTHLERRNSLGILILTMARGYFPFQSDEEAIEGVASKNILFKNFSTSCFVDFAPLLFTLLYKTCFSTKRITSPLSPRIIPFFFSPRRWKNNVKDIILTEPIGAICDWDVTHPTQQNPRFYFILFYDFIVLARDHAQESATVSLLLVTVMKSCVEGKIIRRC